MLLPPFDQLEKGRRLWRGNLHGHSDFSDGAKSAAEVARAYKALGYDFICISDHLWSEGDWSAQGLHDTSALADGDFTLIQGAELHCRGKSYDQHGLWHIVANGLPLDFAVATDQETGPELVSRAKDAGAFVTIAHPEWYGLTTEEANTLSQAHGVEIYNHTCALECDRGSGVAIADFLLNEGHRPVFTATDDSHFHSNDFGGGWVWVAADTNDQASLISALKAGDHYSSTGAEIHSLALEDKVLEVRCSPAVSVTVAGQGAAAAFAPGPNLTHTRIDLTAFDSPWFRVTVTGPGGVKAWSNPYRF